MASGKFPVIGHYLNFRKSPFHFFQKHTAEQKDLFWFDLFGRKFLVLNHPEAIKHVLINKAKNYTRKPNFPQQKYNWGKIKKACRRAEGFY